MHETSIKVIYPDGRERSVTIPGGEVDPRVLITNSRKREEKFRNIIENIKTDNSCRRVMIDLYRHLVLGNFTTLNGEGGKKATAALDKLYSEQGMLPDFELQPRSNASGMIVYNILKKQNADRVGYRIWV